MIEREEIDSKASELDVHAANVQRDYVTSWFLSSLFSESRLGDSLVLGGGNCLRKGYFPKSRYSPDLDLSSPTALDLDVVKAELVKICKATESVSGVRFDHERTRASPKKRADPNLKAIDARVYFRDFYGEESEMTISLRVDLSRYERLYLSPTTRKVIHDYSDSDRCDGEIRCMAIEEVVAAKMKCLLQRRHVADLFDLVFTVLRQSEVDVSYKDVLSVFLKKTVFSRGTGVAKGLLLDLPLDRFEGFWDKFVVCPVESRFGYGYVVDNFSALIERIFPGIKEERDRLDLFTSGLRNPIIEAGQDLTLLKITYDGYQRLVEPYVLAYKVRKDGVGREYLWVWDRTGGSSGPGIKALVASGFSGIKNTEERFEPRFSVELAKAGEVAHPLGFQGRPGRRSRPNAPYVVQCSVCGRKFPRRRRSTRIRRHNGTHGAKCPGHSGWFV